MTAQKISLPQAFLSSLQISHFTVLLHFNGRRLAPVRCAGLLLDGPVIGRGNSGLLISAKEGQIVRGVAWPRRLNGGQSYRITLFPCRIASAMRLVMTGLR